jgi:hypothetical protein
LEGDQVDFLLDFLFFTQKTLLLEEGLDLDPQDAEKLIVVLIQLIEALG